MAQKQLHSEKKHTALMYVTSFIAGFVILTLEVLGFRLYAPYFGSSVYVSGSLISMVLIAITAGYYLGGRLADKKPTLKFLYTWIMLAAAYLVVISLFYERLLGVLSSFSPVFGVILVTIVMFAFPMVALSMVSPFLVKVLVREGNPQHVGSYVGVISAISTGGSILGTLAATFFLIPSLGSQNTFLLCDAALFGVAIFYLATRGVVYLLSLAIPFIMLLEVASSDGRSGAVFEEESVYNLVKVYHRGGAYSLHLNSDRTLQSLYDREAIFTRTYYDMLNLGPILAGGKDVLILGMGGGTSANQMSLLFDANVEGVEIDPKVVEAAERFFRVREINPGIVIHVMDGRRFLLQSEKRYDVIEVDVFHGGMYIPFHMSTVEFFGLVRERLKPGGVMVMNVVSFQNAERGMDLFHYIANSISKSFPSVFAVKMKQFNVTVIGANGYFSPDEVQTRIAEYPYGDRTGLQTIMQYARDNIFRYEFNPEYGLFTDDRAPIERVTYAMLKSVGEK